MYRSHISEALPAAVPSDAAAAARDTLGAAVGIAGDLPGIAGASLLEVARDAFVQGMHATSLIAAVVAIGIAVLAAVVLRNLGTSSGEQGGPDADTASDDDDRDAREARGWAAAAEA